MTKALIAVLRSADLTVDTEKAIRHKLEARMGVGLKEFKPVIRETIEKFLANPSEFADVEDDADDAGETITMAEIPTATGPCGCATDDRDRGRTRRSRSGDDASATRLRSRRS